MATRLQRPQLGGDPEQLAHEILELGRQLDQQIGFGQGGEFAALAVVPPPSRAFAGVGSLVPSIAISSILTRPSATGAVRLSLNSRSRRAA